MREKLKRFRELIAVFIYPEMARTNAYYKNKMKKIKQSDKYIVIQPHVDIKGLNGNAYIEGQDIEFKDIQMKNITTLADTVHMNGTLYVESLTVDSKLISNPHDTN